MQSNSSFSSVPQCAHTFPSSVISSTRFRLAHSFSARPIQNNSGWQYRLAARTKSAGLFTTSAPTCAGSSNRFFAPYRAAINLSILLPTNRAVPPESTPPAPAPPPTACFPSSPSSFCFGGEPFATTPLRKTVHGSWKTSAKSAEHNQWEPLTENEKTVQKTVHGQIGTNLNAR
jgi:hypothetical protein